MTPSLAPPTLPGGEEASELTGQRPPDKGPKMSALAPSRSNWGSSLRGSIQGSTGLLSMQAEQEQSNEVLNENILTWFKRRNGDTLKGALAFVPWVLQQAYFEGGLDEGQIVIHRGSGAVVFSDASGFTALTERLAKKSNGAELLSQCLTAFFTPLIDLINAYRGDVIKFSGDALTIYFQAVDDTQGPRYIGVVPPHGTFGLPDLGPMATAVLRASACCIEIHKRLHMFDTGVDGVRLCLHIGVGCGPVHILQVGGVVPPETHVKRCEYIIAGPPLEQISIAEPLAKNGETCLSPQAWEHVRECVIEGAPLEEQPDYHLLLRMDESKYTFPTIKHAARANDNRLQHQFRLTELNVIRRYIPSAVFKQIECGTLTYVNEMRNISVIFISGSGLDVMSERGANVAQELMASVQRACYQHEGTLNKFLIDDKGMLFLLVFGLPPLVHTDDPTRAVLACFDMVKVFERLNLTGRFGVTTGRSYCGVCGSARRMEYTVLGDCVNLSARLMSNAPPYGILCDEETKTHATTEVIFNALAPIKVKGKANPIPVFQPVKKDASTHIGISTADRKIRFPWHDHPFGGAATSRTTSPSAGVGYAQHNVELLCSVKTWEGIVKVQSMLGGQFSWALHTNDQTIHWSAPTTSAPDRSPFNTGGVVVLRGQTGMGTLELAEHIVVFSAQRLQMMPIFGTMGPRPGDSIRLAVDLIRSTLGVFRVVTSSLPPDDYQALTQLAPPEVAGKCPMLRQALLGQTPTEKSSEVLAASLDIVSKLLVMLAKQTPVMLVLQFEYGTSLFPMNMEDQIIFWKAVSVLSPLFTSGKKEQGSYPLVLLLLCREADESNHAVVAAKERDSFVSLCRLNEENILEYMSSYLEVPDQLVPQELQEFVSQVTSGNPLYIRETIDQLRENHIQVNMGTNKQVKSCEVKDIEKINVSMWQHTAMVGGTVCVLESLDPLEAAVLKMSTCFTGTFTLPDLAASTCSRWADSTHFDFLRLFMAINTLKNKNIIEVADGPSGDGAGRESESPRSAAARPYGRTQHFQTRNVLIRAVGASMVLEAQRKSVKRQALIDRALNRELPARMEILALKQKNQHIPWYYEQAFRRM